MDNSFFDALSLLGSENNVDIAQLVEKVKSAMLKAARKAYPECEDNITVEIDPATKKFWFRWLCIAQWFSYIFS